MVNKLSWSLVARHSLLVAALGDSITAGTPYWDPNPEVRDAIGNALDKRHQWPYWVQRDLSFVCIKNHGVNLERTDQIRERLAGALTGADVLILQGGINDVVQQRSVERVAGELAEMVRDARRVVEAVVLANVLPWNNGYPHHVPVINDLNREIAAVAASENIPLLDFHEALADPARPGRMPANLTSDGNHPSVEGHRLLGRTVSRYLRRFESPNDDKAYR